MNMNFLQDHNGDNSSTRLIAMIWFTVVLLVWAAVAIHTRTLPDLPMGIVGSLTAMATWMVANKHVEVNAPKTPVEEPQK